uniref:Uncharacterized protein n=1 Tax=Sexangularia sp. CB-2014 TaxID=1486929 RepID=A0A7S1V765_9EUKA
MSFNRVFYSLFKIHPVHDKMTFRVMIGGIVLSVGLGVTSGLLRQAARRDAALAERAEAATRAAESRARLARVAQVDESELDRHEAEMDAQLRKAFRRQGEDKNKDS